MLPRFQLGTWMTAARHLGAVTVSCARNRFDPVHAERTLTRALTTASYPPLPRTIGIGNGTGSSWTGTRPARVSVPLGKVSAWLTYDKVSKIVEEDNKGFEVRDNGERDNIEEDAIKAEMANFSSTEPSSPMFGSGNSSRRNDDSFNSHPDSDSKRSVHLTDDELLSLMAALGLLAGSMAVVLLLGYFTSPRGNDDLSNSRTVSDSTGLFRLPDRAPLCLLLPALLLPDRQLVIVLLLWCIVLMWEIGTLSEERTYGTRMKTAPPPPSPCADWPTDRPVL